jgi:hypothetical protein
VKSIGTFLGVLGLITLVVLAIWGLPLGLIASLNILFGLHIDYGVEEWLAALFILFVISAAGSSSRSSS